MKPGKYAYIIFAIVVLLSVIYILVEEPKVPKKISVEPALETKSVIGNSRNDSTTNLNELVKKEPKQSAAALQDEEVALVKETPKTLLEQYLFYKARETSIDAQYSLYTTLKECPFDSLRFGEDFEYLATRTGISEDVLKDFRLIYEKCKSLYNHLGDANLIELRKMWLEMAAEGGHPIAKLELLLGDRDKDTHEEALPLVYESFRYSNANPELLGPAYTAAQLYYNRFVDKREITPLGQNVFDVILDSGGYPWDYLACKYSDNCEMKKLLELMREHFYPYEIEEMSEAAQSIERAVQAEDWPALNLR